MNTEVEAPLDDVIRSLDVMLGRDGLTEALRRDIHDVRGRLLNIVKGLRRITPL